MRTSLLVATTTTRLSDVFLDDCCDDFDFFFFLGVGSSSDEEEEELELELGELDDARVSFLLMYLFVALSNLASFSFFAFFLLT